MKLWWALGRSSLKQYMPNKPTKRVYKIWCSCYDRNGYTCCFQVYTGKVGDASEKFRRSSSNGFVKGFFK